MSTKIEAKIDAIEEFLEECKPALMSSTKLVVERESLEELIQELRSCIPDEVKRYQKMISNKEQILADAQAKADQILAAAQIQTNQLVSEHQIMQQAYAQANEVVLLATKQAQDILDKAATEANEMKMSAMNYTDQQLKIMEDILSGSIIASKTHTESLVSSLQGYLDVVSKNRSVLFPERVSEDTVSVDSISISSDKGTEQ